MAVIGGSVGMAPRIGPLLREWRTAGGFTLGKLAQKSGVDKSALSRWESGGRSPRVPELEATLDALNATPAQRALALASINAPRILRRLRQAPSVSGLGAPPAAGDLLRAMRTRKGWTQGRTAAQVGVGQGTIARWERGERLPSAEQWQSLCYHLGAREEELVALTMGRFSEGETNDVTGSITEREQRLADGMWGILYGDAPEDSADLVFLTLERKAWKLAANQRASSRAQLGLIYAYHAEWLRKRERWAEAGEPARRALELGLDPIRDARIILRAAIISAWAAAYAGNRPAPQHGLHILSQWLPRSGITDFTAWILSDMAKFAAQSGDADASLTLANQAYQATLPASHPTEIYLRRMDNARLLLQAGNPDAALKRLEQPFQTMTGPWGRRQLAEDFLIHAEANLLSGDRREAQDWLQRGLTVIEPDGFPSLRSKADALTERF